MSYAQNDIKYMPLAEFLDPCLDPGGFFLTAKQIDAQKAGFFAALAKGGNDDARTDQQRDKRIERENGQRYDFVHRISYNKAIGYISRRDQIPLYNGSSFNRKPAPRKNAHVRELKELSEIEILRLKWDQYAASQTQKKGSNLYYKEPEKVCHHVAELDPDEQLDFIREIIEEKRAAKDKRHTMSKRTKEKIRDKMLAMYKACTNKKGLRAGKVCFTLCTLTFIGDVSDKKAMQLLNNFLTALRYRYRKINYISVTERQGNGRAHFHVLLDLRLPIDYINSLWVKQQIQAGIRNIEAENKLLAATGQTFEDLHTRGQWKEVQKYLNPVDIDRVQTIDGISCYLTKYVTKNDGFFDCSVWSCSESISHLFTSTVIPKHKFDTTGDLRKNSITNKPGLYKAKDGKKEYKYWQTYINRTYYGQYCTINNINNKSRFNYLMEDIEEVNRFILKLHTRKQDPNKPEAKKVIVDPSFFRSKIMMQQNNYREQYTGYLTAEYCN